MKKEKNERHKLSSRPSRRRLQGECPADWEQCSRAQSHEQWFPPATCQCWQGRWSGRGHAVALGMLTTSYRCLDTEHTNLQHKWHKLRQWET